MVYNIQEFHIDKVKSFVNYIYKLYGQKNPQIMITKSPKEVFYCALCHQIGNKKSSIFKQETSIKFGTTLNSFFFNNPFDSEAKFIMKKYFYCKLGKRTVMLTDSDIQRISPSYFSNHFINVNHHYSKNHGAFSYIMFRDLAIISKPPTFLNLDDDGRLHSTHDYCFIFEDGFRGYCLHGVRIGERLFKSYKTMSSANILQISNVEQKAAIIQDLGYEKIIKGLNNYDVIDQYTTTSKQTGKQLHYEVIEFGIDNFRRVRAVKVECHTEHKITTLGVPILPQTNTCMGAIAWTFGMKKEQYNLKQES